LANTLPDPGPGAPARSQRTDSARPACEGSSTGTPVFEALERRRLLSADPALALQPLADDFDAAALAADASRGHMAAAAASNALITGYEIVFVDAAVDDADYLLSRLTASMGSDRRFEIVRLNGARDGIAQVAEALAGRAQIDALHFVTHGGDGWLQLGATRVDEQSMSDQAATIARWGDALKANADVFLYGCDIAADSAGRALVETLARLARTDVAASTDDTGLAALGGDWDLEYRHGDVNTALALTDRANDWSGLLAVNVVKEYAPPFSHLDDWSYEIRSDQAWGQAYRVSSGPSTYVVNAVEVVLARAADAPPQTITLSIRNFLDWNGAPLASASIQASDVATFERWQTFDLGTSLTLNRDQIYYIRVDSSGPVTQKVYLGVDSSRPFSLDNNLVNKDGNYVFYHDAAYRLLETVTADVPSATNLDTPETYSEDGGPFALTDIVVSDPDSANVTATLSLSDPAAGTLSTGTSGSVTSTFVNGVWTASGAKSDVNTQLASVTFTPSANYNATFGITTYVSDGTSSISGTKTVTGIAVNDAPSVSAAPVTPLDEGTNTSGGVTVTTLTTVDPDFGETFAYSLDAGLDASRFNLAGNQLVLRDGVLDFEAKPSYSVVVRSTDAGGLSSAVLVSVPVVDVNEPPTVTLANVVTSLAEDVSTASPIQIADVIVSDDALGVVMVALAGTDAALFEVLGNWLFLKAGVVLDHETDATFDVVVTVDDPGVGATPDQGAPFSLAVSDVNEPPVGNVVINGAMVEDGTLAADASGIVDPEGLGTFLYRWQQSLDGLAWSTIPGATSAAFVPGDAQVGYLLRVEARYFDGQGDVKAVTSAAVGPVANVNDAPVGAAEGYVTAEDSALDVPAAAGVLVNDTDIEASPLTAVLVSGPARGTLLLGADGGFRYVPNVDFHGADGFTYRASDGAATSADVAVVIDVATVNDTPAVADDAFAAGEDVPLVVTAPGLLANDGDVDGDVLMPVLVAGSAHGTVALGPDGSFVYTPDSDFSGADGFTYRVSDGSAVSSIAAVSFTVVAANDAPVARPDAYTLREDEPLAVTGKGLLANDSDADADALEVTLVSGPQHGSLTLARDGTFAYAPDADFVGDDAFTYAVRDPAGAVANAQVVLTVTAMADAPRALGGEVSTAAPAAYVFTLGDFRAGDADGDAVTAVHVLSVPGQGELELDGRTVPAGTTIDAGAIAAGRLRYLPPPEPGAALVAAFDFAVSDGVLWSGAASMRIGVAQRGPVPVPAPVAAPVAAPSTAAVAPPSASSGTPVSDPAAPASVVPLPTADATAASTSTPADVAAPSAASAPASGGARGRSGSSGQQQAPVATEAAPSAPAPASDASVASAAGVLPQKSVATARADLALAPAPPEWRAGGALGTPRVADGSGHATDAGGEAAVEAIKGAVFRQELDRIRSDAEQRIGAQRFATGTVMLASSAISVGYVLWLLRGGILLSSLLSSLPAWRFIDPLPVLARFDAREDDEDDDSLEELVAQARASQDPDRPEPTSTEAMDRRPEREPT
jgi:hypothetical protein